MKRDAFFAFMTIFFSSFFIFVLIFAVTTLFLNGCDHAVSKNETQQPQNNGENFPFADVFHKGKPPLDTNLNPPNYPNPDPTYSMDAGADTAQDASLTQDDAAMQISVDASVQDATQTVPADMSCYILSASGNVVRGLHCQ